MKDLNKFNKKIKIEAIVKSAIYGLSCGFVLMIALNLVLYLFHANNFLITILLGLLAGCGAASWLYFKKYTPTIRDIAKRVDELGLEERAITMIEHQDDDSLIANLQKKDALNEISKISETSLKVRIAKPSLIVLLVCFALVIPTMFLHHKPATEANTPEDPGIVDPSDPTEDEIIQEMIDDLYKIVDNAPVKDDVKNTLYGMIEALEAKLKLRNSNLTFDQKVELIEKTKEEILAIIYDNIIKDMLDELHKIVDEAPVKDEIKDILNGILDKLEQDLKNENLTIDEKIELIEKAKEEILQIIRDNIQFLHVLPPYLKQYEITAELGQVIQDQNVDGVAGAVQAIKATILASNNQKEAIIELRNILLGGLEYAVDEENSALIDAIQTFADELGLLVGIEIPVEPENPETPENPDVAEDETNPTRFSAVIPLAGETVDVIDSAKLEEVFKNAEENIKNALMSDNQVDKVGDDMATEIEDALDKIDQIQQGNQGNQDEDENEAEKPSNGGNEGDPTDEDTPPVDVTDKDPLDSEKIIDGETPYLEVFEEYYDEIIEYLNNNELDDDARQIIENYLKMIDMKKDNNN